MFRQLTKTQIQERRKRRVNARRGLQQKLGTRVARLKVGAPGFVPLKSKEPEVDLGWFSKVLTSVLVRRW